MDAMLGQRESGIVTTDGGPRPPEQWWVVDANGPAGLIPEQRRVVPRDKTPDTIAGWQAVAEGLLSAPVLRVPPQHGDLVALRLDLQRSSRACFKWAAMAAIASHHVRLALFPLRLDTDRTGYVDIPRSLSRRRLLLTEDVNTIRATNNAIFNDIFWVHLAYATADDGIERLRLLLREEARYAPVLAGFEVRGVRQEVAYFTSFDLQLTRSPEASRTRCVRTPGRDHPLRRPLALAREERRSPLPETRCRHPPDRRQPAAHRRRSARSGEVEAVEVHDLVPGRHEVADELLLRVALTRRPRRSPAAGSSSRRRGRPRWRST